MGVIEQRYAQALAGLTAKGVIAAGTLQGELEAVAATLRESEPLRALLASPAVRWEQKHGLINVLAERARWSKTTRNFLLVTAQRGRAARLEGIIQAFEELLLEREGIVRGEVTSARELAPEERAAIESGLAQRLGRQLQIRYRVDDALVGGFLARVGDQVFDGSIAGRLDRLRTALIAAS